MIYLETHAIFTYAYNVLFDSTVESAIQAQTFYYVPGHEREERFLCGIWDGKEQLFLRYTDSQGRLCHKFPTGLLHRVATVLHARGEGYQVVPMINRWVRDPKLAYLAEGKFSIRPYQVKAAMKMLTDAPDNRLGGIIQMGTGGGKSNTAAKVIQLMQVKTVFLVNQVDLQVQVAEAFEKLLGCKIGQVGGGKHDIQDITVATLQTVALAAGYAEGTGRVAQDPIKAAEILCMMQDAGLVILDECHAASSRTARAAVFACVNAMAVMGLSASPWRDDGTDLLIEAVCGPIKTVVTASELIRLGFLVAPDIIIHQLPMPIDHAMRNSDAKEFHKLYQDWVVGDAKRNGLIAELASGHVNAGRVVIVLIKNVEHGHVLNSMIPQSVFMHGTVSKKKRKAILDGVKSGETRVLIATSLADQGLDIPIASALILAGGGKSSTKALQRIGRVLRPHESKTGCFVHDIVDQHSALVKHYKERLKLYRAEPAFRIHEKAERFSYV